MRCRVCNGGEAASLGVLPDCAEFAGQQVVPPIPGGELWCCRGCGSMFRFPTLGSEQYLALYQAAPVAVWEGSESRRNDFAAIYAYLQRVGGRTVLDIGCHTGGFLAGLPDRFAKYGVEPSGLAASSAMDKGIRILGNTLGELNGNQTFDVVTAIDVIEHMADAGAFLKDALAHVSKGGMLIISSGNPDSFYWKKVFKSRYWYSGYPEHLVFPSFGYVCMFAQRCGLGPPEQIRFRYATLSLHATLLGLLHQLAYGFFPALYFSCLRMRRFRGGEVDPAVAAIPFGGAGIFTDHHLMIIRQGEAN